MSDTFSKANEILNKYWGYDHFRPQQKMILNSIFTRDNVLAVMATGGGKSICFQVPAIMVGGLTWIFTPLISLMKDQQEGLKRLGVNAIRLTSEYCHREQIQMLNDIVAKEYGLVYVAPEQLKRPLIRKFWETHPPSFVVIDEAHCISQWGHDFRPAYWQIGNYISELPHGPVLAFTATASPLVQDEIIKSLKGHNWRKVIGSFRRDNIELYAYYGTGKAERFNQIIDTALTPMIIFAGSRNRVEQITRYLQKNQPARAFAYHAGLAAGERMRIQNDFLDNQIDILVSTCAFGMGVDKPNIRTVVHVDLPPGIDAFYQEIGRAGRDGKRSRHYLLQTDADCESQLQRMLEKFPDRELAQAIWPGKKTFSYREQIDKFESKIVNTVYEHWWVKGFINIHKSQSDWRINAVDPDFEKAWNAINKYQQQILDRFHYLEKYVHVNSCKMQYLCGYFSEETAQCGHCDVCNNDRIKKEERLSKEEIKILKAIKQINGLLKIKSMASHFHFEKKSPHIACAGILKNVPFPIILGRLHRLQKNGYVRAPKIAGFKVFLSGKGNYALEGIKIKA